MNSSTRLTYVSAAVAFGLLTLPLLWGASQDLYSQVPAAPSNATLTLAVSDDAPALGGPFMLSSVSVAEVTSAQWTDIKDITYENRQSFFSGLKRLQAKVDFQINELVAKRATMDGIVETQDWDFAMKEMENSRSYLRSMGEEATSANVDTWNQIKAKVEQAWLRTQAAYGKVKGSTTT